LRFNAVIKRKPARKRLDFLLVERGLADSLQKAAAIVLAGEVQVDGNPAKKAGMTVTHEARIEVISRQSKYASRGGLKLEGALQDFAIPPADLVCLDVGASHGGFSDCLLQHGAVRVYAIDVNIQQLVWRLRQDARVIPVKRNARELRAEDVPELVDLAAIDVSFISVQKVIAPAAKRAKPGADFLILVKPQFELPRREVGAGGIVRNSRLHKQTVLAVCQFAESCGLECLGVRPSRLPGAEGNQEYFLHARKKCLE
jgi:23S rRNA (cytidine1920-2'-O)/16S rRNA (cytidine1409-2'-O)-methyltransferase